MHMAHEMYVGMQMGNWDMPRLRRFCFGDDANRVDFRYDGDQDLRLHWVILEVYLGCPKPFEGFRLFNTRYFNHDLLMFLLEIN